MSRPIAPIPSDFRSGYANPPLAAEMLLREARKLIANALDLLEDADCPKAAERAEVALVTVRLAINSAGGAARHFRHRLNRSAA